MTGSRSGVKTCLISTLAGLALPVWLLFPATVSAQRAAQSDPTAVALVKQALARLSGGTEVRDVTLEATATYTAGSDEESGTATLVARGNQESNVVLNLNSGRRQEVRQGAAGSWTGPDGQQHWMSMDNCWVDADWFFPALTLQALQTDATLGAVFIGPETKNGQAVTHLQLFHVVSDQSPELAAQDQARSVMDLYLDAVSYLPVALDFILHPDSNPVMSIDVEVLFGDYRPVNGAQVPFHIQKYLQGSLVLDLVVSSVAINSGVPESQFTIQAPPPGGTL